MSVLAAIVMTFIAGTRDACAHDYWLEAQAADGGATALRLFVGECLKADEEKRYESARTTRLEAWNSDGPVDLRPDAKDDAQPIFTVPANASERLIVFERNASHIELEPLKFDAYLHEEGLEAVRAERKRNGESDKPGRERYLRFLKTLTIGNGDEAAAGQIVGSTLELVPMEDPSALRPGERLHVRALLENQPLPGAKIELCVRGSDGKIKTVSAISDRLGDVAYSLPGSGVALVRTVHMRRVTDGDPAADWESLWAGYSFIVRSK